MSLERAKEYFKKYNMEDRVRVLEESSATVDLAAKALNCRPGRIAKSLSFKDKEGNCILVVAAGDAKVDNAKYKSKFNVKAKMLTPDEALELIGHEVGGICPFGIKDGVSVYTDISLKRFETIFPACGSSNSLIELNLDELYKYSNSIEWVDVCKGWQETE